MNCTSNEATIAKAKQSGLGGDRVFSGNQPPIAGRRCGEVRDVGQRTTEVLVVVVAGEREDRAALGQKP